MKIVTLIENHTENELKCEHGLSFYIEYAGKSYLLDAGQSELFAANAEAMGIQLADVDKAVISHAHYDHVGGFGAFTEINPAAMIYMQKAGKRQCFSQKADGLKNIGIPDHIRSALEGRVIYADGDMKIADGVYLIAHHSEGLAERGRQMHMFSQMQGEKEYDDFLHEQSLVFELPEGLVVFNSCNHGGVDLAIEEASAAFGGKKILAMLVGFHLMGSGGPDTMRDDREQVCALAKKLLESDVEKIYTGHCTGTKAFGIMKEILGDKLEELVTGKTIELL